MKSALVTGASGFIAGYLIPELLEHEWQVIGIDNFSKYGPIKKSFDDHPNYQLITGDAADVDLMIEIGSNVDQIVAGAAMIGGISYFHQFAYDLLATNERIMAATFDAAIDSWKKGRLERIVVLSSSMVYESTTTYPTPEGDQQISPPPHSTYGFQKLATEYFAKGAFEQYGLPFTILRPFNCVGIGETTALRAIELPSGNAEIAMSHVVPDLVLKVLKGQDPLHILGSGEQIRHFTYGGDLARGIRLAMESAQAINEDFNLSSAVSTTIKELATIIWKKINGDRPLTVVTDPPFSYDVERRIPDVSKARTVLNFEATTSMDEILNELVPWITSEILSDKASHSIGQ